MLSKCVLGASVACVCEWKSNRARECESKRGREAADVCWWELRGRMAAHVWTASEALKKSAEPETHWGTHLVHHLWGGRKDLAMPAEVKEVSVCWNCSICSASSLFFSPSLFLQRTGTPQLRFLPLLWWMKETSLASLPYLSVLLGAVSLCFWLHVATSLPLVCVCVCAWD